MGVNHGFDILNITINCKPTEIRHLRTIEGKTIREGIRVQAIKI
jgi:hypothetical protein